MLHDSNFEEILARSVKSKERQLKKIRLKTIQKSLKRKEWFKKYRVPISLSGVAASLALFYMINLSYESYKSSLVLIDTHNFEMKTSQIVLNKNIEKINPLQLPSGNLDSVAKLQSQITSTAFDSHHITEKTIEGLSYSNANNEIEKDDVQLITYRNENSFSKGNNKKQDERFINGQSHSVSREFYFSGNLNIIEDSEYIGKAPYIIRIKTDIVDSYKIDNDTLFVKIINKEKFNKLDSYCNKNIENFTFWIDKDLNLIIDTRLVFDEYLIIRKK